jgi:hypothetical protein
MIVSDVVTRVLRQFGDEASVQISEEDIIRWINDCARELAIENKLGETTALQSSVADQNLYTLPGNCLAVRSIYYDMRKLDFYTRAEYDAYVNNNDPKEEASGTPFMYTRFVDDILLYPKPDAVKDIKVWYFARPDEVTTTTDTLPFTVEYHNRIVEYCLQQAYQTDEDWDAAERMRGQLQDGMARLKRLQSADEEEFYPSITTLPDDGGYWG